MDIKRKDAATISQRRSTNGTIKGSPVGGMGWCSLSLVSARGPEVLPVGSSCHYLHMSTQTIGRGMFPSKSMRPERRILKIVFLHSGLPPSRGVAKVDT